MRDSSGLIGIDNSVYGEELGVYIWEINALVFFLGKGTRENTFENAGDAYSANCVNQKWRGIFLFLFYFYFILYSANCENQEWCGIDNSEE